jgi:CheY-like chemotaxis protein
MRVLVVEDMIDLCDALCDVLQRWGHDVVGTMDAPAAMTSLERDGPVDVVLCDAQLPGVDGPTLVQALRRHPTLSRIPVVVLSAWPEHWPAHVPVAAKLEKPSSIDAIVAALETAVAPRVAASV